MRLPTRRLLVGFTAGALTGWLAGLLRRRPVVAGEHLLFREQDWPDGTHEHALDQPTGS